MLEPQRGHVILPPPIGRSPFAREFSSEPDQSLVSKVRECQERGVEVSLVPRLYESINERATLDHVGGLPLVALRPTDPHRPGE